MDILKRIGAGILGAIEGILIAIIIMFVVFNLNNAEVEEFSVSVGWCVLGGLIGTIICACYPPASLAIFIGLIFLIRAVGTRYRRN